MKILFSEIKFIQTFSNSTSIYFFVKIHRHLRFISHFGDTYNLYVHAFIYRCTNKTNKKGIIMSLIIDVFTLERQALKTFYFCYQYYQCYQC